MLHYVLIDMKYVESAIKMADFDSVSYIESHNIWTTRDKRLFCNTRLLKDDFFANNWIPAYLPFAKNGVAD
jgi:hypothetical protein